MMNRPHHRRRLALIAAMTLLSVVLLYRMANLSSSPALFEENDQKPAPLLDLDFSYTIDPSDKRAKYFVYQPSGGWGNQRLILTWAMRAANAMDRILIVPMVGSHSMMWYGYDRLNATTQMVRADKVLDVDALNLGLVKGLRIHQGPISQLRKTLRGTWKVYVRPKGIMWFTENAIKFGWRKRSEQVVFWSKSSMWLCCAGGERMVPYIMFSQRLKRLAHDLIVHALGATRYNAIHVRRGGGHTRIDRRTAGHYLDMHIRPASMNTSLPLYVATDEKNRDWFVPVAQAGYSLVFWSHLVTDPSMQALFERETSDFPAEMKGDVIGFLEQIICARALVWTGSDGSTFSFAIKAMRRYAPLRKTDWKELVAARPDLYAKIYSNKDGEGAVDEAPLLEDRAQEEE